MIFIPSMSINHHFGRYISIISRFLPMKSPSFSPLLPLRHVSMADACGHGAASMGHLTWVIFQQWDDPVGRWGFNKSIMGKIKESPQHPPTIPLETHCSLGGIPRKLVIPWKISYSKNGWWLGVPPFPESSICGNDVMASPMEMCCGWSYFIVILPFLALPQL